LLEDLRAHHVIRRTFSRDPPTVNEDDPVGKSSDEVQLVAYEEHGKASSRDAMQQLEHGHLVPNVEECRRLIENECATALRERSSQPHALPLTAGQRVDRSIAQSNNTRRVDSRVDRATITRASGVPDSKMRKAAQLDVVVHAHCERELFALRDYSDVARELRAVESRRVSAVDADDAA
jgi:hypothetical protein